MEDNSTHITKLDSKIKDTLNNYQADFDATDWDKLEVKLNTAAASKTISKKYIVYAVAIVALIGGSYFIYNSISSKSTTEITTPETKTEVKSEQPIVQEEKIIAPAVDSNTTNLTDTAVNNVTEPIVEQPEVATKETNKTEESETDKTSSKAIAEKNKIKKEKKNKNKNTSMEDDDGTKPEKIITMGNEPVFGDMLDSSRGIIRVTKEKEETKQAAKSKSDVPVGWNQFMLKNVNVDSLRNYRAKKDSIK